MQLTCPNCGSKVPAEHINIQRMAAVCPNCDTVFQFDLSAQAKAKRRKIKQPQQISVADRDDQLNLAFRTNFRLDEDESFYSWLTAVGVSLLITLVFIAEIITERMDGTLDLFTVLIPIFSFIALMSSLYGLGLHVFNKTHIDVDHDTIHVARRPLVNPLSPPTEIDLDSVESIRYEETPASVENKYDTPRYNVWAQTVDGRRKPIADDLIEDYAVFVSQRINERLEADRLPVLDASDDADYDVLDVDDALFDGELRSDRL